MKSLKIEINCNLAINPLEEFFSLIPEADRENIWNSAKPFLSRLIFNAINNLAKSTQNPNFKNTNMKTPFIETSYPVQLKWGDVQKEISEGLLKISKKSPNVLAKIPLENKQEQLLNILNRNRISIVDNDIEFEIPNEHIECQKLINGDIPQILKETETPLSRVRFKGEFSSKKLQFEGVVFVIFTPLLVVKNTEEIRFPIFAGLKTLNNAHETFTQKQEKVFWENLLKLLGESLISNNNTKMDLLNPVLNTPKSPLIKSPVHLEALKQGHHPESLQLKFPFYKNENPAQVDVIGLNLDKKHRHALNAIQKLLAYTKYKGNTTGTTHNGDNSFNFTGYLPRIKFTRAEYLEAYGVKKYKTSRGKWEFSGRDANEALGALGDLATQNHLIVSKRKRFESGHEVIDRIQTVSPVLKIFEGWNKLTKKEDVDLDNNFESESTNEKHAGFLVEPCPLLVDQIETYFVLKPANMYQEIKLKVPSASKYVYAFIDLILHEAHLKKSKDKQKNWPKIIEFSRENLAYKLRLDGYIKSRNWKRIGQILSKCVQVATSLGWISKHEESPGKTVKILDRFFISQKKFEEISKNQHLENDDKSQPSDKEQGLPCSVARSTV